MATWDRYKSLTTSLEVQSQIGLPFFIRSFCDDPTGTTYETKVPLCKLKMTPVVQFINTNIAWDVSESDSSTGTIDTFDLLFGGGGASDLTSQDWSVDPKTGNVQYTSTGTYTAQLTVTDTLGKVSRPCKVEIRIVDYVSLQRIYIGTTDGGCFILTPTSGPTASNTGLSGTQLNFRAMHMHPFYKDLPPAQQHLWAATEAGVSYTTDGAANWTNITEATLGTPTNDAGDSPAPAAADPDNIDLCFDPQDPQRIYLLRTITSPNDRTWIYYTDDYGTTWSNVQVSV